jgi:hypothetical protein
MTDLGYPDFSTLRGIDPPRLKRYFKVKKFSEIVAIV